MTWAETTGAGYTLFGQTFNSLGALDAPLNLGTSDNSLPLQTPQGEVASFCFDGSYVLVYVKNEAGDSDIRATVVDPLGVASAFLELSDTALVDESNPAVAMIADEVFAATWVEPGAGGFPGSSGFVVVQLFDEVGAVSTAVKLPVAAGENADNIAPAITLLANGNFLVTSSAPAGTELANIFGQLFNPDGTALGSTLTLVQGIATPPNGFNDSIRA